MENKLLREKIRDLDLRISDLAEYLKISRPTLYKYIDMYEEGNRGTIDTKILNLFDYIQNSKNIGNSNVIYYIMNNIIENSNTNNSEEDKRMKIKSLSAGLLYSAMTVLALFFSFAEGRAQDAIEIVHVVGVVTDMAGEPLPGVSVVVQGTQHGTSTDVDGQYSITVAKGAILSYRFIGFETEDRYCDIIKERFRQYLERYPGTPEGGNPKVIEK